MSQKKIKRQRLVVSSVDNENLKENKVQWKGFWEIAKRYWKFILFLTVMVLGVYWNSLHGNFVSDDYATITDNPTLTNLAIQIKSGNSMSVINSVIANMFGVKSPVPFHVFNTLLYVAIVILAYVFSMRLFGEVVGSVTGLIFATMPVHVESVSWISGKPYLVVSFFFFLIMNLLLSYLSSREKKVLYWWLTAVIIGLMFERVRLPAAIPLAVLIMWCFDRNSFKQMPWGKILTIGGLVSVIGLIILWPAIQERVTSVNSGYNATDSIFYNPLFQYPLSIPKYLQLVFLPIDLTLYHTMYVFPAWLNWLITLSYMALLVVSYRNDKRLFFGLSFIFLSSLSSMAPIKVSWLVAERYIFLGSYGFALALAVLVERFYKKLPLLTYSLVGLYVVFGLAFTYMRNIDWQTNHNLWVRTVQVSPNSHNAWNNIGDDYDKLKQFDNAIKGFGKSYEVKPNYADAYHNQANIFFKTGRLDLARWGYETAISLSPTLFQTYVSLTQIDLMEKKPDLALMHASKAIELQPGNPSTHYMYGMALVNLGRLAEAKAKFEMILSAIPNFKPALEGLNQIKILESKT